MKTHAGEGWLVRKTKITSINARVSNQEFESTLHMTSAVGQPYFSSCPVLSVVANYLPARFTMYAFPYYAPGTSNGARPAARDRVLFAFVCGMSECVHVNFTEMKGRKDADIFSSSDSRTTRKFKDYLTKQGGRLSSRKSGLVLRQVIDALDNATCITIATDRSSLDDRRK